MSRWPCCDRWAQSAGCPAAKSPGSKWISPIRNTRACVERLVILHLHLLGNFHIATTLNIVMLSKAKHLAALEEECRLRITNHAEARPRVGLVRILLWQR